MTTRTLTAVAISFITVLMAVPWTAGAGIRLQPVLSGLSDPLYATSARDGSNRLFIVERRGVIKVLQPGGATPTVFLDIASRVHVGPEQGLLGLAFHPQYASNRRFFVHYSPQGTNATVIAEYRVSEGDPNVADSTETVFLTIPQPFPSHNGGMVEFGPDGFLYISKGDGSSGNDTGNRAQNVDELLGKILRIDVDHPNGADRYSSPPSNPFFGDTPGRDEIYAMGLRNPWRFSFDRGTGQLWVGDVGQGEVEEIDVVTAGGNYGWRVWEGSDCTDLDPAACSTPGYVFPVIEYRHTAERCAVTGGYVYRGPGASLPPGVYVYGDYCSGEIFQYADGASSVLLDTGLSIASFGEDEAGEIYVVGLDGTVDRIVSDTTCTFSLSPSSRAVPVRGIQGARLDVRAPVGCDWTAVSNDPWITITAVKDDVDDDDVAFSVAPNFASTAPRVGTLTIAGLTFTVTQAGCTYALAPASRSVPVGGIQNAVASVSAPPGCPWTAASNDTWITVTNGQNRSGDGQVVYSVAPNYSSASMRIGTMTIAGRSYTVTEAGCTYTLTPTSRSLPVGGIPSAVAGVTAPAGCGWTADSNDVWITVINGRSHAGSAQVAFRVASNQGNASARNGTLTIAGLTFTVMQAGCSFSLTPTGRAVPVGGVQGAAVAVSTPAGCGWTAAANDAWLVITSGQGGGSGNGQVIFRAAPNQGSTGPRTGTLTIAEHTFTVVQAACAFTLSATSRAVPAGGVQSSAVGVATSPGCAWTAASNDAWIEVTSGSSGAGNGQMVFRVASNPGPLRTGTLTVAGRTFTVSQAKAP